MSIIKDWHLRVVRFPMAGTRALFRLAWPPGVSDFRFNSHFEKSSQCLPRKESESCDLCTTFGTFSDFRCMMIMMQGINWTDLIFNWNDFSTTLLYTVKTSNWNFHAVYQACSCGQGWLFEYQDKSKLIAVFGYFRVSGFRCSEQNRIYSFDHFTIRSILIETWKEELTPVFTEKYKFEFRDKSILLAHFGL